MFRWGLTYKCRGGRAAICKSAAPVMKQFDKYEVRRSMIWKSRGRLILLLLKKIWSRARKILKKLADILKRKGLIFKQAFKSNNEKNRNINWNKDVELGERLGKIRNAHKSINLLNKMPKIFRQRRLGAKRGEKGKWPSSKWAGVSEWEKRKVNSGMQKYFLERCRQMQGEKRGDWHWNVNRERMKKPHTSGFLKSPLQYVWGQSHRLWQPQTSNRTEKRGEQQCRLCWKERALLLSADFTVCPWSLSPEKGDHPKRLCLPSPAFPWHNNSLRSVSRLQWE